MRTSALLIGLRGLIGLASAIVTSNVELMEALRQVPEGWKSVGLPKPDQRLHFRIAMSHPEPVLFEQTLYDISTPDHTKYGQHLRRDELKAMLRPHPEATESVVGWLRDAGISESDIVDDGDWINFIATISQAEKMMDTTFGIYRNQHKKIDKVRTLHYSVPEHLHQYVDMIQPTTRFGQIRPQGSQVLDFKVIGQAGAALNVTSCNTTITPDCLKSLYNVFPIPLKANKTGFLGITGFLEEYARFADLTQFEAAYAPYMNGETFTYTLVNGGLNNQTSTSDSVEANLDAQYGLSLGFPVPGDFYSTGGRGQLVPDLDQPTLDDNNNEPYLDFLTYILAQPDGSLPSTLTTSYGEDEQSVPEAYSRRVCNMFGQLGARGVSILFSSGDTGVGAACQTNDGKNTTRFLPIFPAACPYVTSVGGTFHVQPERAVSFSSGGFSDRFPRPAYQNAAVSAYLTQLGNRWEGLYNPAGRGFPDVAAQGQGFRVVDKGRVVSVGGTSASAPTFAGIIALINAARISAGQPGLGFLNPFIYQKGYTALTDIVDGGSTGCTGVDQYSGLKTPVVPYASWNATKGWDPVTGYGTPNFGKLLNLAMPGRYKPRN